MWWQWQCKENEVAHEWPAPPNDRTSGQGCAVCAGKQVQIGVNDLQTKSPELAADWDDDKNAEAHNNDKKHPKCPQHVTFSSAKKVFWKRDCGFTEEHRWQASPNNRHNNPDSRFKGCSVCAGQTVQEGFNDLATVLPRLVREWDFKQNAEAHREDPDHPAAPQHVTFGSNSMVHWKKHCVDGEKDHEWEDTVYHRSSGRGCSVCHGYTIQPGVNDLKSQFPNVAAEWDDKKNAEEHRKNKKHPKDPEHVTAKSNMKAYWKCGKGHRWPSTVLNRTEGENGCPDCAQTGFKPDQKGSLYVIFHMGLQLWKVGIANDCDRRLKQHEAFGFITKNAGLKRDEGCVVQTLESKCKRIIFDENKATSAKNLRLEQFPSGGYTEAWCAETFTPEGIRKGDCEAMLKWLLERCN